MDRHQFQMSSSFEQYLGTNYVPTAVEMIQINRILESSSLELSRLDSQIEQLKLQLDALQQNRSMIANFMEQHQMLISPARRLAHDIIVEIFIECLPVGRNPCMSPREAPMLLTHIRNSWRELALSTPRLWAAVHVVLPSIPIPQEMSPPRSLFPYQEELARRTLTCRQIAVKEWLDRSGAYPLSISVFGNSERAPPGMQVFDEYFKSSQALQQLQLSFIREIILPYHRRWCNLKLFITHDSFKDLLESELKAESLEMLKKLGVHCGMNNNRGSVLRDKWKDILASLVPSQATSVEFYGIPLDTSDIPYFASHNWAKLTELDLHLIGTTPSIDIANAAATIVSRCKRLTTLKLNFWDSLNRQAAIQTPDKIVLKHLETLTLSLLSPDVAARSFVKRLSLPNLKELDFQFGRSSDPALFEISQGIIQSLVGASEKFDSLRLSLPQWMKSHTDMIRILSGMPYLKFLRISSYQLSSISVVEETPDVNLQHVVNDELLLALMPSGKEDVDILCPVLQIIICDCNVITGISEPILKEFVKVWKNDHRRISVAVNDYKMEEILEEEKVAIGDSSSIYFRKCDPQDGISSPYLGVEGHVDLAKPGSTNLNSRYEMYHDL